MNELRFSVVQWKQTNKKKKKGRFFLFKKCAFTKMLQLVVECMIMKLVCGLRKLDK